MEKNMNARIQHKHDIEANWIKAVNFIPKKAELIVYDPDENFDYSRIKIGDGIKNVNNLPFNNISLPDTIFAHQQLVTDKDGNKTWVNMTHYSDLVEVQILPQQDVTVTKQPTLACYWKPNIKRDFNLIKDSIYTIKFNGTEYQCIPYKINDFYYIGNASLWTADGTNGITGNNEPFVFRVAGNIISFIVAEAGTYNIAMEGLEEIYYKINGNYTGIYSNDFGAIALNQDNVNNGGKNSFSIHGTASGENSFSHGKSLAMGKNSFATIASSALSENQFTTGTNNIPDMANTYAHIVGNGSTTRSNAHTLDWAGNAWYQGDVYVGSTSGTNRDDGSKKLATEEYIDGVTTNKVNVSDIVNNLTTNVTNKPLSAAQGVALKAFIDAITVPTKISELTNDSGFLTAIPSEYITETELNAKKYLTSYTETDPTVPAWAKASSKPTYTASEVGAPTVAEMNAAIAAIPTPDVSGQINTHNTATDAHSDIRSSINTHVSNKSNPHGVTLSQLGVNATASELNYVDGVTSNIQTQLDKKANDFSIEIYNGTGGNPKPVRFASFNYSTCGSENGIAAKISLVSGHGNGSSYAFLEDAIIRVNYQGEVEVDNFKYYGAATGTYDGANRQYGDIFWLVDETNKIVDFYCLMGQYSRVQQTPWKRLTYSTGGTVTQHTSCTVYSSGTKVWGNNSDIALKSDLSGINLDGYATTDALNTLQAQVDELAASVVTTHSGSENPVAELGEDGDLYLVTE